MFLPHKFRSVLSELTSKLGTILRSQSRAESIRLATTTTITTTKIKTKTTKTTKLKKLKKRTTVTKTKTTKTKTKAISSCYRKGSVEAEGEKLFVVNCNTIENHQESCDLLPQKWDSGDLDFLIPLDCSSSGAKNDNQRVIGEFRNNENQFLSDNANKRNRTYSFECFSFGKNIDEQHSSRGANDGNQADCIPSSSLGVYGNNETGEIKSNERTSCVNENGKNATKISDTTHQVLFNEEDSSLAKLVRGNSIDIRLDSDEMEIMNALFDPTTSCPPVQKLNDLSSSFVSDYSPSPDPAESAPRATLPVVSPSSSKVQQRAPALLTHDDSSLDVLHTSLQMDLLNKDGRIGIYLPEARKKRIAKFLAKRQKRIWHKKTRYSCRKKLAHNRVRVKGRFVKSPPGMESQARD